MIRAVAIRPSGRTSQPDNRVLRFLITGVVNVGFGYFFYAAFVLVGVHPQIALIFQYVFGVVMFHMTYGRSLFGTRGDERFPRYVAACVAVYLFNAMLLQFLMVVGTGAYLAQAIVLVPILRLSYEFVADALRGGTGAT